MLGLAPMPRRRRPSLTPMIDVVFLLLVFFMLAARFGVEGAISLSTGGEGAAASYQGPPRLVELATGGITLNGRPLPAEALPDALARLTEDPADTILIRPGPGVSVQALSDVLVVLSQAGFTGIAVTP